MGDPERSTVRLVQLGESELYFKRILLWNQKDYFDVFDMRTEYDYILHKVNQINYWYLVVSIIRFSHANQLVYFWPSLSEFEQDVLRDSFKQISRRSCIKFEEQVGFWKKIKTLKLLLP